MKHYRQFRPLRHVVRLKCIALATLVLAATLAIGSATAAPSGEAASSGGLTFYLGVAPSELVKGPTHLSKQKRHHGLSQAAHEHHVFVAIFDAANSTRITDATVIAKVSGLASVGHQTTLEPMSIADAIAFGALFILYPDLYTISVTVRRPDATQPVTVNFTYDHRRP